MENSIAPEKIETKKIATKEKKPISKILLVGLILNLPFILICITIILCILIILGFIFGLFYLVINIFKRKQIKTEPIKKQVDFLDTLKVNKKNPWWSNEQIN